LSGRLCCQERHQQIGSVVGSQSLDTAQGIGPDITVLVPSEERVRFVIDTLARFIIEDGTDLEQLILEAESRNPEFDFLRNVDSPEHMYYRWRLYSLCNEDGMGAWRTEPFVMIEGSNKIHPPPLTVGGMGGATAAQQGAPTILLQNDFNCGGRHVATHQHFDSEQGS
jgi:U2-associated protein SR140